MGTGATLLVATSLSWHQHTTYLILSCKMEKTRAGNSRHTTEVVAINKQGLWPVLSGANMTTRDDKWTGYFVGHQGRPGVVVAELNGNGEMSSIHG